ncbi:hypothetical protein [Nonomuraea sp. CA-141351]|uniref:hypothetical protein n=1 Tax=Nonomuraea sp. CA-141351 TaxID=3239996 RepID=UPI003D8DA361
MPERRVYEITDEGRKGAGHPGLCQFLEKPDADRSRFVAAVSLMGCLPLAEAQRALRGRASSIESVLARLEAHMRAMANSGLPEILMLEVECEQTLYTAELDWVRRLLDRLDKGELGWETTVEL